MTVSDDVAARIRRLRRERGWTVNELAQRCARLGGRGAELTPAAITNIESGRRAGPRGRRPVAVDELIALAAAFSVPPGALMSQLADRASMPDPSVAAALADAQDAVRRLAELITKGDGQ